MQETVDVVVRVPKGLRDRLKQLAKDSSMQEIMRRAIESEIKAAENASLPPMSDDFSLAQRFLECIPTPVVIKDLDARIVWCNLAYEQLFNRSQSEMKGHTIQSLGLMDKYSGERLSEDINEIQKGKNRDAPIEFWEPVTIGRRNRVFKAFRFGFETKLGGRKVGLIGDISFEWSAIQLGERIPFDKDIGDYLLKNDATELRMMFQSFLERCPTAIAIKTLSSRIEWCNPVYLGLIGKATGREPQLTEVKGLTTREIFKLNPTDAIVQHDATVGQTNVWICAIEQLPNLRPRTSLRFPIPGPERQPAFVGVASAEFLHRDIHQNKYVRRSSLSLPTRRKRQS